MTAWNSNFEVLNGPIFPNKVLVTKLTDCQSINQISLLNVLTCIEQSGLSLVCFVGGEQETPFSTSSSRSKLQLCSKVAKCPFLLPKTSVFPWVPKALTISHPHSPNSQLPPIASANKLCSQCDKLVHFGDKNLGTYPSGKTLHIPNLHIFLKKKKACHRVHGALTIIGSVVFIRAIRY